MSDAKSTFPHVKSRQKELAPGTVVGRNYLVVRSIGQGGMSRVYAAVNVWTQREVALKVLALPRGVEERGLARFIAEAKTSARLTHPNIVRVLDLGTDERGLPFIVQELIQGESLADCLVRLRRLSIATAVKIFVPILDALTMAHDHGVVHRDVTPNNILLAEQATGGIVPKLNDFGVAREMALEGAERITEDGTLLGTPLFMSPEQVRAQPDVDGRCDVWAVGASFYLAVTGKVPFAGNSLVELAAQIIMASPKKPSERNEKLPAELDEIVLRALQKDPKDRYPTARAFRDALREMADKPRLTQDSLQPDDARIANALDSAPRSPLTVGVEAAASPPVADVGALRAASRARPLRVGMVVRNAEAHATVEAAFASTLQIRCDVWCYFDYAELVDALSDREIEFAWLPPVAYVRAHRAKTARLLLTVERSGRPTYAAAVLARKGQFRRLEDIESARAVWVDPWSAAGYMMPLALLRSRGVDPDQVFSSQAFVGSHDAVLESLVARSAEVGATHCTLDDQGTIIRRPWDDGDGLEVLGVSGPIPGDTFCSAPGVSKNLRKMVCGAMLDVQRAAPVLEALGATRMVKGQEQSYDDLERALIGNR